MGELVFSGVMVVFLLFFIIDSKNITQLSTADPVGPTAFPVILATLGILLMGMLVFQKLKKKDSDLTSLRSPLSRRAVFTTVLLVFYVPALNFFGFIPSSFALLTALVRLFGCPSLKKSVIIGFLGTAVTVALFGQLLHVPLPRGLGLLRSLSYFFY
ncbi:MAG: putative tricarboxylic transport rane protein [Synergistales bacterium]|jgi:uncharacterized integral membrane protein|nr:putative tricarboxylic transport rane protein [Synergistales bacterium]